MARFWIPASHDLHTWQEGLELELTDGVARHIQVLRLQPGDELEVFCGDGRVWQAEVLQMGRKDVRIRLKGWHEPSRELPVAVTLAVGMPANDRMDALIEKATELGVAAIQPLVCSRSVLRLEGERASRKVEHWQSVAIAACEQSGRTRVPTVHAVMPVLPWLKSLGDHGHAAVLSFEPDVAVLPWCCERLEGLNKSAPALGLSPMLFLNGPEGGLTLEEEAAAVAAGFTRLGLGPRVLRADTAPLMALSVVASLCER